MIEGNDGGANVSFNGGRTLVRTGPADRAVLSRRARQRFPLQHLRRAAGQLDRPDREPRRMTIAITDKDWYDVGGGESGWIAPLPDDSQIVFAGSYGGLLTRYDHRTGQMSRGQSLPGQSDGFGAGDIKYRFQWNFPILFSPFKTNGKSVLYAGGKCPVSLARPGPVLGGDLARPDPQRQVEASVVRRAARSGQHEHRVLRHDLYGRRIACPAGSHLDRQRRRPRSSDAATTARPGRMSRRRECPIGSDQLDRGFAVRPGHGVCCRDQLQAGRPTAVSFIKTTDYGKTWKKIINGIPDHRLHPRHSRGPESPEFSLRRHRNRRLLLVRLGRIVAESAAQPAGRADPRSRRSRNAIRTWSSRRTAGRSMFSTTCRCSTSLPTPKRPTPFCSSPRTRIDRPAAEDFICPRQRPSEQIRRTEPSSTTILKAKPKRVTHRVSRCVGQGRPQVRRPLGLLTVRPPQAAAADVLVASPRSRRTSV